MTQAVVPDVRTIIRTLYSTEVLADSPIGYWRLDEPSGTNANDLGSGNHDGTYVNTPTLGVAGALVQDTNTAATFTTGTTEYVNMVGYTTVPSPVSLEAWVRGTTAFDDLGLAGWFDSGATVNCYIYLSSIATAIRFIIGNGTADVVYDSSGVLNNDRWHHIVGTYDGTAARLYFDSVLVAGPVTKAAAGGTASSTFKIANYGAPSGTAFNGTIDEVAVYNTALSAARIAAHWRASAPGQR